MPREGVPQNEFVWFHAKPEECAPHNRRSRFGKTVRALCSFARAARLDAGKDVLRLDAVIFLFAEQDALGSHRDSGEMTAAVPKPFANNRECCVAKPSLEIGV